MQIMGKVNLHKRQLAASATVGVLFFVLVYLMNSGESRSNEMTRGDFNIRGRQLKTIDSSIYSRDKVSKLENYQIKSIKAG
jgi:hypothetical protein